MQGTNYEDAKLSLAEAFTIVDGRDLYNHSMAIRASVEATLAVADAINNLTAAIKEKQ